MIGRAVGRSRISAWSMPFGETGKGDSVSFSLLTMSTDASVDNLPRPNRLVLAGQGVSNVACAATFRGAPGPDLSLDGTLAWLGSANLLLRLLRRTPQRAQSSGAR
jgi:hypothetical protein